MDKLWGVAGVLKNGAVTITGVTDFDTSQQVAPIDSTQMGDTWKNHIPNSGIKDWSSSFNAHFVPADVTGQGSLTVGASFTINIYPEGQASTKKYKTGLCSVVDVGNSQKMDGETVKIAVKLMGNGALTDATVP